MKEEFKLKKPINHIAFIMDGNGRWAKKRLLPRTAGHKEGCKRIVEVIRYCKKLGIKCVTLYAFSTENWNRPKSEIDSLFRYLKDFFNDYIQEFIDTKVKVRTMGDISKLPKDTVATIEKAKELTSDCDEFIFNICLNYGSQQEIVRAAKEIAIEYKEGKLDLEKLDQETFNAYLYSKDLPKVDLMIRTSGEERLSNFILYQVAYAEFVFTDTYWPDFKEKELIECLKEYETRDRRYGKIEE